MRIALFLNIFIGLLLLTIAPQAFGQPATPAAPQCFTQEEAKQAVNLINNPQKFTENKDLRKNLLKIQLDYQKLEQKFLDNSEDAQKIIPVLTQAGNNGFLQVCEAVKKYGWLNEDVVGLDGAAAALYLMRSNRDTRFFRQFFPVFVAAVEKRLAPKGHLAWLIDAIRIGSGMPQIFGTQTKVKDGIFYLFPLLNEAKTDEYRKMYGLASLSDYIKQVQAQFQTIVLKTPRPIAAQSPKENKQESAPANTTASQILNLSEDEVIEKVESNLVNLNINVSTNGSVDITKLQKEDFVVLENDKEQEIEFFSATEAPFDLVLVLDLSGSTDKKLDLIRKSTQRFIEAARPVDRIAIVSFDLEPHLISNLTQDHQQLLLSTKNINSGGGSGVWGAIQFASEKIIKTQSHGRRSAILIMTDGVDTSMMSANTLPSSYPTFMDLLEQVRTADMTIVPVYLDTQNQSNAYDRAAYSSAQKSLKMLAEESGGQLYYAKKAEDLNGVYEKVISDLSKVYSLGYQPKDEKRDGAWRKITVKVPNYSDITVRTKPGYYAK